MTGVSLASDDDCDRSVRALPRLREYCAADRHEKRRAFRDDTYWARPVPGFGDPARAC